MMLEKKATSPSNAFISGLSYTMQPFLDVIFRHIRWWYSLKCDFLKNYWFHLDASPEAAQAHMIKQNACLRDLVYAKLIQQTPFSVPPYVQNLYDNILL